MLLSQLDGAEARERMDALNAQFRRGNIGILAADSCVNDLGRGDSINGVFDNFLLSKNTDERFINIQRPENS